MGVIDHHPGALCLRSGADGRQVGEIAIHAEHTVGHHQGIAFGLVQTRGEAGRIVVQIAREARAGKQPGIQQRGVVEAVFQYGVALADQRGDRADIGHVAGGEQQRTRAAGELGEGQLQLVVRTAMAIHQMRGATAHTPALGAGTHRGDHFGMVGQAQIIIGTEGQHRLAVDDHFRSLRAFQQRALAVEVLRLALGKAGGEIEGHGKSLVMVDNRKRVIHPTLRSAPA
ncbi:hypothetical protein D3C76_927250 [compost metagenome]